MESAILWYRRKIGVYDLQIWEKAVEIQERKFKGIKRSCKQESHLKSGLIDVDLVRGSTFSKNKPQHNAVVVIWVGLIKVLLMPMFFKWWIQQTNYIVFAGFLCLYMLQMICLFLYQNAAPEEIKTIPFSEVTLPCVVMLVLGLVHCQVVATNVVNIHQGSSKDKLLQKRTLSKALLEPAKSTDYKQTLSFVNSTVRKNIDLHNKADNSSSDPTSATDSCKSFDEDILLEGIHNEGNMTDSSCEDQTDTERSGKSSTYLSSTALLPGNNPSSDNISIRLWENYHWQKCRASLLHIGGMIVKKVDSLPPCSDDFCTLGVVFPIVISVVPAAYRFIQQSPFSCCDPFQSTHLLRMFWLALFGGGSYIAFIITLATLLQRLLLSTMFFIMLCAAHQTFKKRLLYAKYFTHLTSSRRAKKSLIPHFRLNKVQNIRVWLAIRSYLRRRGPQRSVDVIVSSVFLCLLFLLCFVAIHLLNSSESFTASLMCWDSLVLLVPLAIFIPHFITVGAKINKKYGCISTLLTEQINLHLQMEKKPHKKERLHRANSVLTLAAKLIKEIEEPFNIYGLAMNPYLYNITRVILLSAFSGVLSEMLGFKLKIWKIKT